MFFQFLPFFLLARIGCFIISFIYLFKAWMYFLYSHIFRINWLLSLRAAYYIEGFADIFCQNCFHLNFIAISFVFHWRFPIFWLITLSIWRYNANKQRAKTTSALWDNPVLTSRSMISCAAGDLLVWQVSSQHPQRKLHNCHLWSSSSNPLCTWADHKKLVHF